MDADNDRADSPSFAHLLRQALIARGWTGSKLAQQLKVAPSTVSKWLAGTRPNPEIATRIEEFLNRGQELIVAGALRKALEREIAAFDQRTATARTKIRLDALPCPPYRGLFAFREEDASLFFGRESATTTLVTMVRDHPLVAVIGPSGSGKSSLLFAGLVPRLRREGGWQILAFRPGGHPLRALAGALLALVEPQLSEIDRMLETEKLAEMFSGGNLALEDMVERIPAMSEAERLLVVADQFEELYTLGATPEERQRFVDALLAVTRPRSGERFSRLNVVIALRADFLGQALSYRPLADALYADIKLGPMNRQELKDVIEKPARHLGVKIEEGLTARLLDAVCEEPGHLPLLEFALSLLWGRRLAGELTHAAYDEMGEVEAALSGFAEEIYGALSEEDRQRARRVFTQLVRPGEGTEDTRRLATRADVGEGNWDLVRCLAAHRLVVTGREEVTGETIVEIVHEALIRHWERLRGWMEVDRAFRIWQERLRAAMGQWKASARDEGGLLRGAFLAEALEWKQQREADLGPAEVAFIQASAAAVEQAEREKELARRRRLRRLRTLSGVLVMLLISVGTISVVAVRRENEARRLHDLAVARELAARAGANVDQQPLSLLLSLESLRLASTDEARFTLLRGLLDPRHNSFAITGHTSKVYGVAFSPDAAMIASASEDGTVRRWDARTGAPIGSPLRGHTATVRGVAFSPDGAMIASASEDHTLRLWDAATGQARAELRGHADQVEAVAFSPDGTMIASASVDRTLRRWDARTGAPIGHPLAGHTAEVEGVAFSPDGAMIASASEDHTLRLWDAATGQARAELRGHTDQVEAVAFSPDGTMIASASEDHTLRLWDAATGQPLGQPLIGHADQVEGVAFSPDGTMIASGSLDQTVRLWDAATGQARAELRGHTSQVEGVAFSPDGKMIASGSEDRTLRLWEAHTGAPIRLHLIGHTDTVRGVAFSPDGTMIASASRDRTVRRWDAHTGVPIGGPLTGHTDHVLAVAFSPDGKMIASGSEDDAIRRWDAATGQPLGQPLIGHTDLIETVAFSPDGTMIASGSDDGTIRRWDARTGVPIGLPLNGDADQIEAVAFSPDGTMIAAANRDRTVQRWNARTGVPVGEPLTGHRDRVRGVAFSPDGEMIASASHDGTVRRWNARTSAPIGEPLTAHAEPITAVTFSPGGRIITAAAYDGTVRRWDARTGIPIGESLTSRADQHGGVAFSPDGKTIAVAGADHVVRVWPIDLQEWIRHACKLAGRNLSWQEWKQFGGGERSYVRTCPDLPSGYGAPADAPAAAYRLEPGRRAR